MLFEDDEDDVAVFGLDVVTIVLLVNLILIGETSFGWRPEFVLDETVVVRIFLRGCLFALAGCKPTDVVEVDGEELFFANDVADDFGGGDLIAIDLRTCRLCCANNAASSSSSACSAATCLLCFDNIASSSGSKSKSVTSAGGGGFVSALRRLRVTGTFDFVGTVVLVVVVVDDDLEPAPATTRRTFVDGTIVEGGE